jgi:opacity protein-like surface antigen
MKKFLACAVAAVLFCSGAAAEDIDLSGLSYAQLVALRDRLNLAIWQSQEWQEVTVPQGVWIGGEDIPVGRWTVRCSQGWGEVSYGDSLAPNGRSIATNISKGYFFLRAEDMDIPEYETETFFDVSEGMYIVVDSAAMVFTTYAGKPDLGFQ